MGKKRDRDGQTARKAPTEAEEVVEFVEGQQPKFGQRLVSNEKEIRDKAVKAVSGYLKGAHSISTLELAKIWKQLYYCFWHSDKPKVQRDLADQLAGLVYVVPPAQTMPFVRTFWEMMAREWHGIDRIRLDKYYVLMRSFLAACFGWLRQAGWKTDSASELAAAVGEATLNPRAPVGLRYFMLDTLEPSLVRAISEPNAEALPSASLLAFYEPYLVLLGAAPDEAMLKRAIKGVIEPLLPKGEGAAEGEEEVRRDRTPLRTRFVTSSFSLALAGASTPTTALTPSRTFSGRRGGGGAAAGRAGRAGGAALRPRLRQVHPRA